MRLRFAKTEMEGSIGSDKSQSSKKWKSIVAAYLIGCRAKSRTSTPFIQTARVHHRLFTAVAICKSYNKDKLVKCKYVTKNTGKGRKSEENTDSYKTLWRNPYDSVTRNIFKARHVTQKDYGVTTVKVYAAYTRKPEPGMVKKVDDMTITEYIKYEERIKRHYSRNSGSYFPTYFGHCTSSNNIILEFPRNTYFPISPNTKFDYDSEDMELDEEAGYTTDEESVMSKQEAIDPVYVVNTQSFEKELSSEEDLDEWVVHKNKQIRVAEDDLKKSCEVMEDNVNNDSFTSNLPSLKELNPGSFLLSFTINNYNSYDIANIDASNNVMPRSIYEYPKLANIGGAAMLVKMDDMTQQETLGTVKNVLVKINKFEFMCDFVVTEMPENPGEMIILGRPFLETIHAQIDDTRNYDNNDPHNEIARQTNPLLDKRGFTKRWHVCKPIQVFYNDGSGTDCRMWPTCDPDSSLCYGYKEVFRKSKQGMLRQWVCFRDHERCTVKGSCMGFVDFLQVRYRNQRINDTSREWRYYEWFAQIEFDNNKTPSTTTVSDKCPYKTNYPTPISPDEWDTMCYITYTGSTSNQNIPNNDPTPFSLDHSELGKKANTVLMPSMNMLKKLGIHNQDLTSTNECLTMRLKICQIKKGYVLDVVWENASNNIKKLSIFWHDMGYEEEELWQSEDEKVDYEPPFVDVKTFEVKKYSFKKGQGFTCITKQDDALLLGRVNEERFREMIRNELKDKGITHDET
nr:hypothetical protein [Tanacetum cinerariifolium]